MTGKTPPSCQKQRKETRVAVHIPTLCTACSLSDSGIIQSTNSVHVKTHFAAPVFQLLLEEHQSYHT
jgi:hypothetical protein